MGKTIFINGRFLTKPVTGVQRYARELLSALDRQLAPDVQMICLAPPQPFDAPYWHKIEVRRVGHSRGNLWEQLELPLYAHGELLFSPANSGPFHYANQVVTMHDASTFAVPEAYTPAFRAKYAFLFQQLAKRAKHLLTVSRFSQGELARYLKTDSRRFTVIHNGADHLDNVVADESILTQQRLRKNEYLLTVASQSKHKNLQSLFALPARIKIVVAGGSAGDVFSAQGQQKLPDPIQMVGYVNDQALKALYQNALGFIFPSRYEGFGLPVLEAMRCGCPVLCANSAALPEIAGQAALYFEPDNIAQVVETFLTSVHLRDELRQKGMERSGQFTWAETARQTLEILCR